MCWAEAWFTAQWQAQEMSDFALVAAGLLVGFKSTRMDLRHFAGGVDLLRAAGCEPRKELVIQPFIVEVVFLVRYPLLQPAMRLDGEFSHELLLRLVVRF